MGIHEWSYDNDVSSDKRYAASHAVIALKDIRTEVEIPGYDVKLALCEAQRRLNCDIQTVFTRHCASNATPESYLPDGLHHLTANEDEADSAHLKAPSPHPEQALCWRRRFQDRRVMVKDEDVASIAPSAERCPTGA
jgi:hypothetical protein